MPKCDFNKVAEQLQLTPFHMTGTLDFKTFHLTGSYESTNIRSSRMLFKSTCNGVAPGRSHICCFRNLS